MASDDKPQLRLYNTLTRTKADFVPLDAANVRMYACGPTVYDFAHIGNARPVIVFDVLFRLLRHLYGESHVTYVRNITDVDDKINARAARDFPGLPLNDAIRRVTEKTASQFQQDARALGCLAPTVEPRATENIAGMQAIIQQLLDKGSAYVARGQEGNEVLFRVAAMPDYGRLSGRNLEDNLAGARVAVEGHKENPADFVLWKESGAGEPGWDAAFRVDGADVAIYGRPGWHIECSAMSERYLGPVFDIHGGGLDLIFPHHENELAQSRCAHGTEVMAQVWMHNGFLQVEGKKMSKSEGNFVTINEVLREQLPALIGIEHSSQHSEIRSEWNGLSARFSMLQTHYREPIDWTRHRLFEASDELYSWYEMLRGINFDFTLKTNAAPEVIEALSDDLNTWQAITSLRSAAKHQDERKLGEGMAILGLLNKRFLEDDDILLFDRSAGVDKTAVDAAVAARLDALNAKNFAEADRIRATLLEKGVQVMDSKDPDTGERRTKWERAR